MAIAGIKARRAGNVSILDADARVRVGLRFGGSSVSLPSAVDALVAAGQNLILLNFQGVTFIDARGLGELVSAYLAVEKMGGQLKISNPTKQLRQLLVSTKLVTVFEIYESETQAVESFAPSNHEVSSADHLLMELSANDNL